MRTLAFKNVIYGVAQLAGLDRDNISTSEFARIRDLADARLALAWESGEWPDTLLVEERTFRPLWDSSTTYAKDAEVYYAKEDKYYQSVAAANTGNTPTTENWWAESAESGSGDDWLTGTAYSVGDRVKYDITGKHYWCHVGHTASSSITPEAGSYWTQLIPFDRYLAYEQSGETKIGEFFSLTDKDPRNFTALKEYDFELTSKGAHVAKDATKVWVRGRKQRPLLTGDNHSATKAYVSGDQIYFNGDFYEANQSAGVAETPTTHPSKWTRVEVPYIFQGYLIRGAFADYLRATGNNELAAMADRDAEAVIGVEADKLLRQQGQIKRVNVLTY